MLIFCSHISIIKRAGACLRTEVFVHNLHGAETSAHGAAFLVTVVPGGSYLPGMSRVNGFGKLAFPIKIAASFCHPVVPGDSGRKSPCYIGCVGSNAGGDDTHMNILLGRQRQVLCRSHIAEEVGPGHCGKSTADSSSDMVIAGSYIRDEGSKYIEGGVVTEPLLKLHVGGNLVEGHVAGALYHDLNSGPASPLGRE